jgi:phosphohistidine phosphatase
MKKLYLMRHAQAESNVIDAPLTHYGLVEAKKMREYINKNAIFPEMVLCSPATRACMTYDKIFENNTLKPKLVIEDKLYCSSVDDLLKIINIVPKKINKLMVIGHNPGINALIIELRFIAHNELYLKALDSLPSCKLTSLAFPNAQWLSIHNTLGCIESVYWP